MAQTIGGKSAAAFTQTSRTSKFSKGTISSLSFKIRLCCGVLELDCMRLLSLISLFINISAFIIVAGVTIDMFSITNQSYSKVLIARGDALNSNELMIDIVRVGALSRNNSEIDKWYSYRDQTIEALNRFFKYVDPSVNTTNFNSGSRNGRDMYTIPLMEEIISHLKNQQYESALTLYQGFTYQNLTATWFKQQSAVFNLVKTEGRGQDDLVLNSSTSNLVVVSVCLAIVIPIVVLMTCLNIRRESTISETLHNSRAIQLLDTMNDPMYSKFFKQACVSEKMLDSYMLLSQILEFNQIQDETEQRNKAQYIYQTYLATTRRVPFKFVSKTLMANIYKDLQESSLPEKAIRVSVFRELEACICEELIPVHRMFMKTIKDTGK